jgi:hypothetical protein
MLHGLKYIRLEFNPALIRIDSMDLFDDGTDCDFLIPEKIISGTTLLEVFAFLKENKQTT